MKFKQKTKKTVSKSFVWGAVAAVLLAAVGATGYDIWLASTQWLIIAAVLILFAIYLK